ncbi:hypothetical protein ACNOYE_31905 [Nannocystaceae bacterium ST9]
MPQNATSHSLVVGVDQSNRPPAIDELDPHATAVFPGVQSPQFAARRANVEIPPGAVDLGGWMADEQLGPNCAVLESHTRHGREHRVAPFRDDELRKAATIVQSTNGGLYRNATGRSRPRFT